MIMLAKPEPSHVKPYALWHDGHWDVVFPCCPTLPSVNSQRLMQVDEIIGAHKCATQPAHSSTAEADLGECKRWLWRAVYDLSQEQRRRAAVLLLREMAKDGAVVDDLLLWMDGSPADPREEELVE